MRYVATFAAGVLVGCAVVTASAQRSGGPPPGSSVAELRLYTIDKGKLDDFANQWRAGVYPLRTKLGYQIPFAAKVPATNQFVWLLTYSGPESWDKKEDAYYASPERTNVKPDPAQLIARPERWFVTPVVGPAATTR
jgi:NIPSNAP